jgi:DNA-binding MarR family transcriptional regulator
MQRDHVDSIIDQWQTERPDVDVSGMGIIGRIARLERHLAVRLETVFAEHGLQGWEFDVLATLRRSGSPFAMTPGQLIDSTMVTSGAVTNRIDRLKARGLVRRRPHPTDGRAVMVELTAKGRRVVDAALVDHAANERTIVGGLTASERAQLVRLLRAFQHTLDADR